MAQSKNVTVVARLQYFCLIVGVFILMLYDRQFGMISLVLKRIGRAGYVLF